MRRLRVAVVGAGFMGALHARAVADSPLCELVGVIDPDVGRRQTLAERFGCAGLPDLDALVAQRSAEALIVAVPDRLHVNVVVPALEAGLDVLVEKPIADTLQGARRMQAAAQASGSRLAVGHILRHDARYAGAAAAMADGSLGDVVHVRASRLVPRSVGAANNGASPIWMFQGVHDIDVVQWVSGREITAVQAITTASVLPAMGREGCDAAFVLAELDDGGIAAIELGWALLDSDPAGLRAELEVVGTTGMAHVVVGDQGLSVVDGAGHRYPDTAHWPTPHGRMGGDLAMQLQEFVTSILDERDFLVPIDAASSAVAVVEAISKAVETRGRVLVARD